MQTIGIGDTVTCGGPVSRQACPGHQPPKVPRQRHRRDNSQEAEIEKGPIFRV